VISQHQYPDTPAPVSAAKTNVQVVNLFTHK